MPTYYTNTIDRPLTDYLGERLSVLSYGAKGDGTTDDAPAINEAIKRLKALNGRDIYLPGGRTYAIKTPIEVPTGLARIRFSGDGEATLVKRLADMPAGRGVFDVSGATHVTFSNFKVDGNVTVAATKQYGTMIGMNASDDPMHADLVKNTTFWAHGNSRNLRFDQVTVTHTGGYAILLDATSVGDIDDVRILDCLFENNRPYLFGTTVGDLAYGSWTGGVHYQGDGQLYAVKNLVVRGCTFRRNTGNCLWGHLYAFNKLHSNIRHSGNHFEDCGLDGIMVGGVTGGVVENNTFRRIGYICTADTGAGVPKYLQNKYAVGLDTAGRVRGVNYIGNSFMSCNGGCIDLDGYAEATVSGNTCVMAAAGEPEYTEDSYTQIGLGSNGVNVTYGVQVSNSNNDAIAGVGVKVCGNTFVRMGSGAVRMYASRKGTVIDNTIIHAADAVTGPITLGTIGVGPNQRAYDNVVAENTIYYSPSSAVPAVYEDNQNGAFDPADKNWVAGNRIFGNGNCFEFQKNSVTASTTGQVMSTASTSAAKDETFLQREGTGSGAYTRMHSRQGVSPSKSLWTIIDSLALMNVSADGAASTGALTTGNRTTLAFYDAVSTGKLVADGFVAMKAFNFTGATWPAADADLLDNDWGLLRFNKTDKRWEQSVEKVGANRVWAPLGGGAGQTFTNVGAVPYVGTGGTLTESLKFMFLVDANNNTLVVKRKSTAALTTWNLLELRDDADVAMMAVDKSGNVYATAAAFRSDSVSPASTVEGKYGARELRFRQNTTGEEANSGSLLFRPAFSTTSLAIIGAGSAANNRIVTVHDYLVVPGVSNQAVINVQAGYVQSADGFVTLSTAGNCIQAPNGGVSANTITSTGNFVCGGDVQIANTSGDPNNTFRLDGWNNGMYFVAVSAPGAAVGTTVRFRTHTAGGGSERDVMILTSAGYGEFPYGLYSGSANYDIFKAPNGGFYGRLITVDQAAYLKTNSVAPAAPSAGYGGLTHRSGATYWYWNGATWASVDFSATGGSAGVSSLNSLTGALTIQGTANETEVSASGSTITIGLAPNVSIDGQIASTRAIGPAISASAAFIQGHGLVSTLASAYNSIQSASGISAGVDSQGGFYVAAIRVINTSGQFVGPGVNCGASGIAGGGFNPYIGGTQFYGITNQDINLSTVNGISVRGGIVVGTF